MADDPHAPAHGDAAGHDDHGHGHDDHGHGHAPEPNEISNPALWTLAMVVSIVFLVWWFFHFLDEGKIEGRKLGKLPAETTTAAVVDHAKLIADDTQAVRDHGHEVFIKNCATCHGPNGDTNANHSNPAPRNFHADAFKNANGGGPFALYCVVHDGLPGTNMPSFGQLAPEDAYAVVHFIRDTWVKTDNQANYVAKDPDDVLKRIPAPGAAGKEAVAPEAVPLPADLNKLMASMADGADAQSAATAKVFLSASAAAGADPVGGDLHALAGALLPERAEYATAVVAAAQLDTPDRFVELLTAADAPDSGQTAFALWPRDRLLALYKLLHQAKA
jgi:mono/diheme cytochrome c family protein